MKNFLIYGGIFILGGLSYGLLEIMWRGFTHWTMVIAGGLAFLALYISYNSFAIHWPLIGKAALGMIVITAIELVFGYIFNLKLGLGVWDYSSYPLNFLGQVCFYFSFLWFILSVPIVFITNYIHNALSKFL